MANIFRKYSHFTNKLAMNFDNANWRIQCTLITLFFIMSAISLYFIGGLVLELIVFSPILALVLFAFIILFIWDLRRDKIFDGMYKRPKHF